MLFEPSPSLLLPKQWPYPRIGGLTFLSTTLLFLSRMLFRSLLFTGFLGCLIAASGIAFSQEPIPHNPKDRVGKLAENRYSTPTNQILTPAGIQVELPRLRPQAIAVSPDGQIVVTSGKTAELIVIDPKTGKILQKAPFSPPPPTNAKPAATPAPQGEDKAADSSSTQLKPDSGAQLSFTGLLFSPDGSRIYLSNVNGDIKVFSVGRDHVVSLPKSFAVPESRNAKHKAEIPSGLAISRDGKRLYVTLNLGNHVAELDAEDGQLLRVWDTGVAPYDVVLAAGKLYVSNWGGRRPGKNDLTGPSGRGTLVRVDPEHSVASEGSVTVIDLKKGFVDREIQTELHASALAVSPGERYVVVANASSDTLSVIDTKTDQVTERIWTRETPADLFSATPNALAFDKSGKRLFVCNATLNAVGIIQFEPDDHESKLLGLIPVGWFPGGVAYCHAAKTLCVANIKGTGSRRMDKPGDKPRKPAENGENSKDYFGTVSLVPLPGEQELAQLTHIVAVNSRHAAVEQAKLPPRPDQPPRPVPERAGEPSLVKHVVYIIKENRTYDQVLGDVRTGNGNASLCTFGEKITPNQHKLVHDFVLLDNTYCSGIQSADGHQWTDSAITTDYVERGHAGWPRSYPNLKTDDSMDALAYSPAGFLWDDCLAHKVSLRNFGEACVSDCVWADKMKKGKPSWKDFYLDYLTGSHQTVLRCKPGIATLRSFSKFDTVGWDLNVPDVVRAARFIGELQDWTAKGNMPRFVLMALPNDHTAGTAPGKPSPAAQVADNDLALGHIIAALSESPFWKETAVFAIEDDPQSGWDHVSGYRTTCYVAGGYVKRNAVVSTQYNTTSLVRTIELILGLPPMNIMDASATPMSDCFTDTSDATPFASVPNQQRLDEMTPETKKIADPQLRKDAAVSAKLPLAEADRCPEDVLNRILWHAMKGPRTPYPTWATTKVVDDD